MLLGDQGKREWRPWSQAQCGQGEGRGSLLLNISLFSSCLIKGVGFPDLGHPREARGDSPI